MWQPVVHQITVNWDYHVCQLVSLSQGRIVFANFVSHFWVAVRFRICGTVAAILTSVQPILTVQANLASLFKPMLIVLASLYNQIASSQSIHCIGSSSSALGFGEKFSVSSWMSSFSFSLGKSSSSISSRNGSSAIGSSAGS